MNKQNQLINKMHKPSSAYRYEIGCWMTVYNRSDLLIDTIDSLLKCKDLKGIKFVIWNDGSTDNKIDNLLSDFKDKLEAKGNTVIHAGHSENRGKAGYDKTLKDCFNFLMDCKFQMPIPADFVFNPYLFQVARKSIQYFKSDVKVISFCHDSRNLLNETKIVNNYFVETRLVDWVPGLFLTKFVKEFIPGMVNLNIKQGTGTPHCIMKTAKEKGYKLYRYTQSLCQHMGNITSALNPEYRRELPLIMGDANLKDMPDILNTQIPTGAVNKELKNILVTTGAGIGNLINLTPTIQAIKIFNSGVKIDLLVLPRNKDVLSGWDCIRNIYVCPDDMPLEVDYDVVVEGMPVVSTYKQYIEGYDIITGEYESMKTVHEIIAHLDVLKQVGMAIDGIPHTYMHINDEANKLINRRFMYDKYIAVCAGHLTEWLPQKNWGYKNFAELIKLLLKSFKGYKIIVIGTGEEKAIFKYLNKSNRIIDCIDKYSIQESAAIIQKCEFIVGNDTGPIHIASALDIPNFAIFGPGCIVKNRAQNKSKIISKYLECSPCDFDRKRSRECVEIECMDIDPDSVLAEITNDNKLMKYEYDLGCWITVHERYDLLLCMITNLLKCKGLTSIKFVICNDGSTGEKIKPLLEGFVRQLEAKGNTVEYIRHGDNWGKVRYHETLKQCFSKLRDCKYQMAIPADWIFNEYLFEVARASMKYISGKIKGISFHTFEKRLNRVNERKLYFKYFTETNLIDWFPYLFPTEFVNQFVSGMKNYNLPTGTGTTRTMMQTARRNGYMILKYEDSLGQHVGCLTSSMNAEIRATVPFYMGKLNLWAKPRILKEEK